jgi:hypothetical protein
LSHLLLVHILLGRQLRASREACPAAGAKAEQTSGRFCLWPSTEGFSRWCGGELPSNLLSFLSMVKPPRVSPMNKTNLVVVIALWSAVAVTSARGALILPGNNPEPDEQNVLLNNGDTGTVILGST